eukprot:TRINITY_DN11819_c0_g1_i1.p1 TRINITY_DN11819_c0_g1~~TRINITY_DN11819_c0_g1_i1.p1  ORF type:complete len:122 (+),score=8.19 TRINITY_DN11819_c0_g1_i1:56-367(+)
MGFPSFSYGELLWFFFIGLIGLKYYHEIGNNLAHSLAPLSVPILRRYLKLRGGSNPSSEEDHPNHIKPHWRYLFVCLSFVSIALFPFVPVYYAYILFRTFFTY